MAVDPEIEAMGNVAEALSGLEPEAASRVIRWAAERHGVALASAGRAGTRSDPHQPSDPGTFPDVASLMDAANPTTGVERVLVASYWFQELQADENVEAQPVNTALKNLGHGLKDITGAFDALMDRTPRLVIQVQKGGKSRQARKKYRVTDAGKRQVREMIADGSKSED